jgi:preprotein translocase subunit SecD
MGREWYWRGGFIALIALGAIYLLVPSYYYFNLSPDVRNDKGELAKVLPRWAPEKKLNLGLDLQGGIHLVMEVDVDAALAAKAANRAVEMKDYLERKDLPGATAKSVNRNQVEVTAPAGKLDESLKILSEFEDMERVGSSGDSVTYAFRPETVKSLKDGAIDQSIKAIRNRVDKFGVTEPTIARRGANHILVQLPGFKDPEQAKELIGKTAQLEFRVVNDTDRTLQNLTAQLPPNTKLDFDQSGSGAPFLRSENQKQLQEFLKDKAPAGYVYALSRIEEPGKPVEFRTYLLEDKVELTGEYLTDARVQQGEALTEPRPHVSLTFNKRGADLFEKLTGEHIQKRMAIVLDGIVDSAPVIQNKISGGSAMITLGGYKSQQETFEDAKNLALVLKAGALPAPVTIAEQRSVGASLGPELIHQGAVAVVVGALLVVLFMLLYYRLSGLIADIALVLNGLLILASLALFGAALSLPGIAGIVLTLGVAVDANVIINERIREELKAGKSPRTALQLGYDRAFAAIFDSNLTTVLSGIVLLQYGTGPIRGFAVTLIIGVTASMFTAIVVTRWMMDFVVTKRPERLSV